MSEKSTAGAAIPVLAFSVKSRRLFCGPGWRKPGGILQYKMCRCVLKTSRNAKTEIPGKNCKPTP